MKKISILILLCASVAFGQVSVAPWRNARATFIDSNGVPLSGGCVFTYQGGTTTPLATYTDYTGGTPNANPVVLDSSGSAPIWLGPNSYKFSVWSFGGTNCATGTLQYTIDQIPGNVFVNGTITGATITGGNISGTAITSSTIDATAIGSTTPSTGAFTTVTASTSVTSPSHCIGSSCITSWPVAPGSYTFYVSGGIVYARNNNTQHIDYQGADAAVVVNNVLTALTNVGGKLYFQNGTYPLSSCTQESISPYTSRRYAIGIPATNTSGLYPSFEFEGESAGIGSQALPAAAGVIFNVTSAAETCAGAGNILMAFWMRPTTAFVSGSLYWNDHVFFRNIAVNFPANTRGYEEGFDTTEASFASFEHDQCGFVAQPSAPPANPNLYCYVTPATPSDGAYLWEDHVNPGFSTGYEIGTEHAVIVNTDVYQATQAYAYGTYVSRNNSPIYHNSTFIKAQAYDCIQALQVGVNIVDKAKLDLVSWDWEYTTTGPWATTGTTGGIITGATTGSPQVSGFITWAATLTNSGPAPITSPFKNDGTSGANYASAFQGAVNSPKLVSVTGNGSSSAAPDFLASRATEANNPLDQPWYEMDGPNGNVAIGEYNGGMEFWLCPGSPCTVWNASQTATINSSGLTVPSGKAFIVGSQYTTLQSTGSQVAGQVACIKSTGPPVVVGTCSGTVNGTTGACGTCN